MQGFAGEEPQALNLHATSHGLDPLLCVYVQSGVSGVNTGAWVPHASPHFPFLLINSSVVSVAICHRQVAMHLEKEYTVNCRCMWVHRLTTPRAWRRPGHQS